MGKGKLNHNIFFYNKWPIHVNRLNVSAATSEWRSRSSCVENMSMSVVTREKVVLANEMVQTNARNMLCYNILAVSCQIPFSFSRKVSERLHIKTCSSLQDSLRLRSTDKERKKDADQQGR